MTRETKIGLLVGLAFIIVIGILLSDHFRSTMEPPRAALETAGSTVRQAVSAPGANTAPPPIVVVPPADSTPRGPLPTQAELTPPTPPVIPAPVAARNPVQPANVNGSSLFNPPAPAANNPAPVAANNTYNNTGTYGAGSYNNPGTITPPPALSRNEVNGADGPLASAARAQGEQIVPVDPGRSNDNARPAAPAQPRETAAAAVPAPGVKDYVAQSGDTLSHMAARLLGANTKANREAIIRLNPDLQDDPNKIIVGQTYHVPSTGTLASTPAARPSAPAAPAAPEQSNPQPQPTPSAARETPGEYYYTVEAGDTLWGIANDELNNPGAVAAIKELNRDVLRGKETVVPGMKLRLPGKPVASAN